MIQTEAKGEYSHIQSRRIFNQHLLDASYLHRSIITNAMPLKVWIEPTNNCNAHCPLCPTGIGELKRSKEMLPMSTYTKVVDEIAPFAQSINLWDLGEPFLHPQIFSMIHYAADKNIQTRVSTNGTAEAILASGLSDLVVSIDGAFSKTIERYRIGIDFDRVMDGLGRLMDLKRLHHNTSLNVVWQFIAMQHNQDEIEAARSLASSLGMVFTVKTVNLDMIKKKVPSAEFLPDDEKNRRYILHENETYILKEQRLNDCKQLWYSLMVNASGNVIPCCYDYSEELIVGQVPQQSIKEIWDGTAMQQLRQCIQEDRMNMPPCKVCSEGRMELLFSSKGEKK
jgi:radical SAM protein with 4Fe4S-binding SPASM domain